MTIYGTNDYPLRTPRGVPVTMEARDDTSDLSVIGSTMWGVAGSGLVDEYKLAALHITGRFVDVGAHVGSVVVAVLLDNPGTTAICVEPIPENVAVLRHNLELNGLAQRAEIIEGAVGTDTVYYNFEGTEHLVTNRFISNNTGMVFGQTWTSQELKVRRVELAELLPCDAMKLDCEGGEWALFADKAIKQVPLMFGEYHYGGGPTELVKLLKRTHTVTFEHIGDVAGNFRAVARG